MMLRFLVPVMLLVSATGCRSFYTHIDKLPDGTYLVTRNQAGMPPSATLLSCTAESELEMVCKRSGRRRDVCVGETGGVKGFDGDPARALALRAALTGLLEVFPRHLAKPQPPTWFEAHEMTQNEQFDAIVRAHKKDRLAMPIEALRASGAPYYGFSQMHPRRLAWFVPSVLASWLDGMPSRTHETFGANEIEDIAANVADEQGWGWEAEEYVALAAFFELALDAALVTPLRPAREPEVERPLEDGVRVWSLHSPSVPLDVLRIAKALRLSTGSLVHRWTLEPTALALDHLVEAVYDTITPSKRLLAWESVAERLADAFFEATGERQLRISKAEKTVRRNIARREEWD